MPATKRRITDYTFTNYAPADDPTLAVYFGIYWTDDSALTMAGWGREAFGSTRHIPGSNLNDTYFAGMGPRANSYRVWLESLTDYAALEALIQSEGTLTLPKTISGLIGTDIDYFGRIYTKLDQVALMNVTDMALSIDGSVECTTLWQRNGDDE